MEFDSLSRDGRNPVRLRLRSGGLEEVDDDSLGILNRSGRLGF